MRALYPPVWTTRSIRGLALALTVLVTTGSWGADEEFPYKAWVTRDRTPLKSGPGDEHYFTEELQRGDTVEVYRRVEEGWLAIRPPATSFSWVAERDLRPTATAEVYEVTSATAVSWIGSHQSATPDHRWLVKLDAGEVVRVTAKERLRITSSGKSEVFCKIAPPAGEFRWIHEDDVTRDNQELTQVQDPNVALADFKVALRGTPKAEKPSSNTPVASASSDPRRDAFSARDKRDTSASSSSSPATENRSSFRERAGNVASLPTRQGISLAPSELPPAAPAAAPTALLPPAEVEDQIRQLEAQLSLAAAQPVESWDFSPVRNAADQLLAGSQSTLERARIQLFLDKLSEFEGLKSRHALMAPKPILPATPKWSPASLLGGGGSSQTDAPQETPRFDGTGLLFPVTSKKRASPPYALLDQDGNILQFVSPAPGLNLNRYLRKEIGVFGQRDQPSTLDKPHLTAQRVVELDRHRK